jgi:hypothetical protein
MITKFLSRLTFVLVLICLMGAASFAQSQKFSDPNSPYTFELPDPIWKAVVKPTAANPNVEYVYGDRLDGHLEIRKLSIKEGETISDLILREQEQKLQFIPGYVAGKEEVFVGSYRGRAFNYEFVKAGKPMAGRFYYLKTDESTVYVLRFTGYRDKLRTIRNQIDSIARTFKLKESVRQD